MTAEEKQQSKIITARLHELEEIIEGERKNLSELVCGLCKCVGVTQSLGIIDDCTCPLNFCCEGAAEYRRSRLYDPKNFGTTKRELRKIAREHYDFLIERLEDNGWTYE